MYNTKYNRETVGKISRDLIQKEPESRDPIELEREMQQDYLKNLTMCVEDYRKQSSGDFYVAVLTKKEKLMPNVFRNYFLALQACPTPTWDQSLYKYSHKDENITYMWTIPSKDTCELFLRSKKEVDKSEWGLLNFIIQFYDGSLMQLAKKLNGEQPDSPLLV